MVKGACCFIIYKYIENVAKKQIQTRQLLTQRKRALENQICPSLSNFHLVTSSQ